MPILILAISVLQIAVQPATAQLKFGFVDTQKILANFQKAKDAFKQFETERNTAIEELSKWQEELLKPVYEEINAVIRSIREKEGYDFIIDSLNLLDAKPEYDLTDKVMKELGVKTTA